MKVLVCGSRHFNNYELLKEKLDAYKIDTIIHGNARGCDTLAGRYGEETGKDVRSFSAQWGVYGRAAGPIRNSEMLREGNPDLVVAFKGPNSRGTQNMINLAKKADVPTIIVDVE